MNRIRMKGHTQYPLLITVDNAAATVFIVSSASFTNGWTKQSMSVGKARTMSQLLPV